VLLTLAAAAGVVGLLACSDNHDSNSSGDAGFTVELSAADIVQLTDFGERPNFSPDGSRIVYVGENYGDAYEIDLATRDMRNITENIPQGIHRIQYLPNGDFLVTAPREYVGENTRAHLEMWILDHSLEKELQPLGERPFEGIAISKKKNFIAWTTPEVELQEGQNWQLLFARPTKRYVAEINYQDGAPRIVNKREIMTDLPAIGCNFVEPQDFRDNDKELVFSCLSFGGQYGVQVSVMGYSLESGESIVYRSIPGEYNEPEGIAPSGSWCMVECGEMTQPGLPPLDLCRLKLKPNGVMNRLFADTPEDALDEFSNPVVSPDGKWVAFQKTADTENEIGEGLGLFLVKLEN